MEAITSASPALETLQSVGELSKQQVQQIDSTRKNISDLHGIEDHREQNTDVKSSRSVESLASSSVTATQSEKSTESSTKTS